MTSVAGTRQDRGARAAQVMSLWLAPGITGVTEPHRQLVYKTILWLAPDRTGVPEPHRWLVYKTSLWLSPD